MCDRETFLLLCIRFIQITEELLLAMMQNRFPLDLGLEIQIPTSPREIFGLFQSQQEIHFISEYLNGSGTESEHIYSLPVSPQICHPQPVHVACYLNYLTNKQHLRPQEPWDI